VVRRGSSAANAEVLVAGHPLCDEALVAGSAAITTVVKSR